MPAPRVTIRYSTRVDRTITIHGVVTGATDSVTISMPAAALPNGATSRPESPVVLTVSGEFTHAFTTCPYGDYAGAIVTATNADGTTTATGLPLRLYVPGTAPIGMPRALFPPFSPTPFNAATTVVGAEVTDITVESTASQDQANMPFTFGQVFPAGALAPGDFLVGKVQGEADIALQFNVKATHQNGSVRHALVSGVMPALPAGASKKIALVRSSSGLSVSPATGSAVVAGVPVVLNISVNGTAFSANAAEAISAMTPTQAWIGGACATEYVVNIPFKDGAGVEHPDLVAQVAVRRYAGTSIAKIDVSVEHAKAYTAINDVIYSGEVLIAGVSRLTIASTDGSALTHFPTARWKRSFWWNNNNPVHIRHNFAYLCASGQIPNYDPRVVVPETTLAQYAQDIKGANFVLMGRGLFVAGFGATGGRPDIGLAPSWYAAAIISQDKRAKDLMLALADQAGSWQIHRRDNSNGPGRGYPLSVNNFPRCTQKGTSGDGKNTATGLTERFPTKVSATKLSPDSSHQPAFAYYPYLLTGDYFYLEEMHFWSSYNLYDQNPGLTRGAEKGWVDGGQVRGQGWNFRGLAQCGAATPDDHPLKADALFYVQCNTTRFNSLYTDNPSANKLGVVTGLNNSQVIYGREEGGEKVAGKRTNAISYPKTGIGVFQDDFVQQAFGHAAELGFTDAARFRNWKCKFHIGRMIAPGFCWTNAAGPFDIAIRETETSPLFETLAQCQKATLTPALYALPCNSPERLNQLNIERGLPSNAFVLNDMDGYAYSTTGFPSNYQPALAMSVDANVVPDSDLAWDLFDSRAVQPKYGLGPQFAIVPRGVDLAPVDPGDPGTDPEPVDPTDPEDPDPDPNIPADPGIPLDTYKATVGQAMYFGRNPFIPKPSNEAPFE